MKLYHGKYIIPGLAVFLAIATFPIWYSAARGGLPLKPFKNPLQVEGGPACIEKTEFMRAKHMRLLNEWRDEVVRDGDRVYEASDGKKYDKSLTKTCMACHARVDADGKSASEATYCLDCHAYVGVDTYCWDCHVDPAATDEAPDGKEGK